MVTNPIVESAKKLSKPLFVFCALISLVPLPLTKVFTGSLLALALMFLMDQGSRVDLSLKFARRFLWVSLCTSALAFLLVFFQMGKFQQLDFEDNELVLFPVSLAISVFALVRVALAIGAPLTIALASGPLLLVDILQRDYQGNIWKYAAGITVTFLVLYFFKDASRQLWLSVFLTLCIVSLVFDTRSIFLLLALSLVISLFLQKLAKANAIWKNLVTLGFAGSTYLLFFNLALDGWFGETVMRLTLEQSGGNAAVLLFGARPEAQGNANLIASNPIRMTPGDPLGSEQISIIRSSFSFSNRDPFSVYINNNILGFEEFHSVFTNLWFHLGVVGLSYGIVLAGIAIKIAIVANKNRVEHLRLRFDIQRVLLTYLALRILWDLAFSPWSDMRVWPLYAVALLSLSEKEKNEES